MPLWDTVMIALVIGPTILFCFWARIRAIRRGQCEEIRELPAVKREAEEDWGRALIAILLPRLGQEPRQSLYLLDAVAYTRDKSLARICLDQRVLARLCSLEHESRCSGTGRGS